MRALALLIVVAALGVLGFLVTAAESLGRRLASPATLEAGR